MIKVRCFLIVVFCLIFVAPIFAQAPPLSSGPNVVRDEVYGWWWNFADQNRGYFVVIGTDAFELCSGGFIGAWWNLQENYPPAEEGIVHRLVKGNDVPASVWPAWILEGDTCEYILSFPPIAEGTVDALANDNDVFAGDYDHNRNNSWKFSAHGALTAPDGENMILNAGYHCIWDGDSPQARCKVRVVLN